MTLQINAEQPALKKKWTDESNTYFYFSYVSEAPELVISPWLILVVASISIIVFAAVFLVLKKRWRPFMRDVELSSRRTHQ